MSMRLNAYWHKIRHSLRDVVRDVSFSEFQCQWARMSCDFVAKYRCVDSTTEVVSHFYEYSFIPVVPNQFSQIGNEVG